VTDLRRSAGWYRWLLDLELVGEFVEQGELRGIALVDKTGAYGITLRDREYCASRPDLAGFDALCPGSRRSGNPSPARQALR
jgi:catechol 2,3-dioxygenase-like lactoylglutathione lyase family enzyme